MKKHLIVLSLCLSFCLFLFACGKEKSALLSSEEAKAALLSAQPSSSILLLQLNESKTDYLTVFSTSDGFSLALIDAESGRVHDVLPFHLPAGRDEVMESKEDPALESAPSQRLSEKEAVAIAQKDTKAAEEPSVMQSTYDADSNTYRILLKSGNLEYSYVIDASNGKIITSDLNTDM